MRYLLIIFTMFFILGGCTSGGGENTSDFENGVIPPSLPDECTINWNGLHLEPVGHQFFEPTLPAPFGARQYEHLEFEKTRTCINTLERYTGKIPPGHTHPIPRSAIHDGTNLCWYFGASPVRTLDGSHQCLDDIEGIHINGCQEKNGIDIIYLPEDNPVPGVMTTINGARQYIKSVFEDPNYEYPQCLHWTNQRIYIDIEPTLRPKFWSFNNSECILCPRTGGTFNGIFIPPEYCPVMVELYDPFNESVIDCVTMEPPIVNGVDVPFPFIPPPS